MSTVYQFRITLRDISPAIWRRIQVPSGYSFWDLHVAIQDAMGWNDSHLHEFILPKKRGKELKLGIPDDEDFCPPEQRTCRAGSTPSPSISR